MWNDSNTPIDVGISIVPDESKNQLFLSMLILIMATSCEKVQRVNR